MHKICLLIFLFSSISEAQILKKKLPDIEVLNLDGDKIHSSSWSNEGKPMLVSFWASWCKPCVEELTAISDVYDIWQKETGVKVFAISIDDARNSSKIKPFVNGKDWQFEVFNDQNGDLKRAMGVINIPHTFLLNGKGEVVWEHTSYSPGNEEEMFLRMKELKNERIKE